MKSPKKSNTNLIYQRVLFAALVCFAFVLQVFFLANIIMWRSSPNKGWQTLQELGPKFVGAVFPLAEKAGLRKGDRILAINGKPYETLDQAIKLVDLEIGHVNVYTVSRDGKTFNVSITTERLGLKRVFIQSGLFWILGNLFIGIGILVFLMKPYDSASWAFVLMATITGIFITYSAPSYFFKPSWLQNAMILLPPFLPATIVHLAGVFPQKRAFFTKTKRWNIAPYLASLTLAIISRAFPSGTTLPQIPDILWSIMLFYLFGSLMLFLGSTFFGYRRTSSAAVRLQSLVVFTGVTIALLIPMVEILSDLVFRVSLFPNPIFFYLFFLIFFPLSIGYAIVRHDLFEIDTIIRRTYGYVLTTGSIAGVYALFVFVSNLAFGRLDIAKSPMFPLVFILAVVFFFNPVRNRVQKFIDRIFYRLEYDYQETVQKISESMRTLLGLDEIGKSIMDTALGAMFIDSGSVMLLNREKETYECLTMAGKKEERRGRTGAESTFLTEKGQGGGDLTPDGQTFLDTREVETGETEEGASGRREEIEEDLRLSELKLPADEPLIQKIGERKKEVTIYDIEGDPFYEEDREAYKKAFDQMEATLIVPLIYEDRLTGLISLGDKKSGKFYRREDINLLNTLANQGVVAIENAKLLEEMIEKERMEEELAIAHDLQTSMLPATCPEIEGFKIAALSIPAREVGGDFYDFIEMGKDRVGFVIGDVTGKSVSGALVMSSSRSVFRMLSEEQLSVGDIMIRANRRIKKDITSGMFVALLYAVLDAQETTLSLCSAGQTQPIYLSAETGKASLVETQGDTFPLGILDEPDYKETRLQLAPGDMVILYTDGIVEAMNKQEEMFGFERLLGVVRGARTLSAEALLKEIMDRVNEFVGGAAQHDDLTVIVVSVEE